MLNRIISTVGKGSVLQEVHMMFEFRYLLPHGKYAQFFKNNQNRPKEMCAAKPLLKTTEFSPIGREKAKFPTLIHNSAAQSSPLLVMDESTALINE